MHYVQYCAMCNYAYNADMENKHASLKPVDRWTRRKLKTQRAIQLAALRLAAEHGIEDVTVQAISEAADIAPRTFFTHFSSKEEALALDRLWTAKRLEETILSRPADENPLQVLRILIKDMALEIVSDVEAMNFWKKLSTRYPDLVHRLLGTDEERVGGMARAIAQRAGLDVDKNPYPSVIAWTAWVSGQVAVDSWLKGHASEDAKSVESIVDEVFDVLESGFSGPGSDPSQKKG